MQIKPKLFEVFCGTGGVGKTTLATARALHLAKKGLRVLLITIDPAKRLKEVLKLEESGPGVLTKVSPEVLGITTDFDLTALLMSPETTLERISHECRASEALENKILSTLSKPYGGMNEIFALLEVQYQTTHNSYDVVVLDTPPGKHFIDFLEACTKINVFFDKNFMDIFKQLSHRVSSPALPLSGGIVQKLVSSGIKKLLGQLEKVTGGQFINEFISAISLLYQLKDPFLKGLELEKKLKDQTLSNWFLVTSVDHNKLNEALHLGQSAKSFMHDDHYIILNKCLSAYAHTWENFDENSTLGRLKNSLLTKEKELKDFAQKNFKNIIEFQEILDPSPQIHIKELALQWERHTSEV